MHCIPYMKYCIYSHNNLCLHIINGSLFCKKKINCHLHLLVRNLLFKWISKQSCNLSFNILPAFRFIYYQFEQTCVEASEVMHINVYLHQLTKCARGTHSVAGSQAKSISVKGNER
jgi:hypothetical protein